jgi:hypothetical protein
MTLTTSKNSPITTPDFVFDGNISPSRTMKPILAPTTVDPPTNIQATTRKSELVCEMIKKLPKPDFGFNIVGGMQTDVGEFPHMVF